MHCPPCPRKQALEALGEDVAVETPHCPFRSAPQLLRQGSPRGTNAIQGPLKRGRAFQADVLLTVAGGGGR